VLAKTRDEVRDVAQAEGVSESEVWRTALEVGLPLVPKQLARKRRAQARKNETKTTTASNVVPITKGQAQSGGLCTLGDCAMCDLWRESGADVPPERREGDSKRRSYLYDASHNRSRVA
jgi:hypothetical protein